MKELQKLINDIIEEAGVFVEDIKMSETGGTIKVICDTEKGISSSELVTVTRMILNNPVYDETYSETYRLEVSSPGIDMPLTLARHFKKNSGREIELLHTSNDQKSPLRGTIERADDDVLELQVKIKKEHTTVRIPMEKVTSATVRLKW